VVIWTGICGYDVPTLTKPEEGPIKQALSGTSVNMTMGPGYSSEEVAAS
jgi:hypothetical protein